MLTKIFTFQLENDRRTVETSLFFNVNFYSEICFKKLVVTRFVNKFRKPKQCCELRYFVIIFLGAVRVK